jgi:hypothetical protein
MSHEVPRFRRFPATDLVETDGACKMLAEAYCRSGLASLATTYDESRAVIECLTCAFDSEAEIDDLF